MLLIQNRRVIIFPIQRAPRNKGEEAGQQIEEVKRTKMKYVPVTTSPSEHIHYVSQTCTNETKRKSYNVVCCCQCFTYF